MPFLILFLFKFDIANGYLIFPLMIEDMSDINADVVILNYDNAIFAGNNGLDNYQMDPIAIKSKLSYNEIYNLWERENREDIINRLHQLVNIYTIEQLQNMNIKLMNISEIKMLSYLELRKFYITTCKDIKKNLNNFIELCVLHNNNIEEYSKLKNLILS